ncbi:mCG1038120, isoform CRA_a, partial [Mus musculus]
VGETLLVIARPPGTLLHWHGHLQLLPEPALRILGFLSFPFNDREHRLSPLQLFHLHVLHSFVLH